MRKTTSKHVWIRETNASKPLITRRDFVTCRQNQGRFLLLGQACQKPDYWTSGDRRKEGVTLIRAFAWNCGNQSLRCQGKCTSSKSYEAKYPMRSTGTDRPVRAMRTGNAVGAKGTNQAVVFRIQLETGGDA
jgi:hypothetical protein